MPLLAMQQSPSLYSSFALPWSSSPFVDEVREVIEQAHSVAVNILGARDAKERSYSLRPKYGKSRPVKRIKAHKIAFLHVGADRGDESDLLAVRWMIGIASFLLGNVSAPFLGDDFSLRRFAAYEYTRVERELKKLKGYKQYKQGHEAGKAITQMLLFEKKVFQILRRNAEMILLLRITVLVCSTIALVGALLGGAEMLFFGAAGLFLSTSALLLKMGFDSRVYLACSQAEQMREYVDYLLSISWWTGHARLHYPIPRK